MRDLGKTVTNPKSSDKILKILFLGVIFSTLTFFLIKFLHLDKYVFKGPKTVVQFITNSGLRSDNNRINVLLLGIGGKGHDGPDLTDTIIFVSIDKDSKDVALVSIPRDLWAPNVNAKINHAYAYGEENGGNGLVLAKETVADLFQMPVHYAFRIDFSGFTKAVDQVGGLDLEVETAFVDPRYPILGKEDDLCGMTIETEEKDGNKIQVVKSASGSAIPLAQITDDNNPFECRYEALNFKAGQVHMDGITSLKFVRSRHGTNGEGSDFARAARQQKVILAFRQKVISSETFLNPKTIIDLMQTFGESIDTDVVDEDIPLFAKIGSNLDPVAIRKIVLDSDEANGGRLEFGKPEDYQGQSVLVPKGAVWTDLAEYVQSEIFKLTEDKQKQS